MAQNEYKRILKIDLNYKKSIDGLVKLDEEITKLEKHLSNLNKNKHKSPIEQKEIEATKIGIKQLTQQYNTLAKEVLNGINSNEKEVTSLNALKSKAAELTSQYNALSEAERNNEKVGGEMVRKIAEIEKKLDEENAKVKNLKKSLEEKPKLDSIDWIKQEISELKAQFNALDPAMRNDEKVGGKLIKKIAEYERVIEKTNQQLKNAKKATGEYSDSVNGLRAKLNELLQKYDSMEGKDRNGKLGKETLKQIKQYTVWVKKAEEATARFQRNVGNYSSVWKKLRNLTLQLGFGVLGVAQGMVALGNTIKDAIKDAIYFNRELSKIEAITGAAANDIGLLAAKAKELGATTRYTATEVAELQVELAKLGYTVPQIAKMSEGVLYLAQATGTDLASAAKFTGATLRSFGLDVDSTMEVVDKVAQSTSASALSFDYLVTSMQYVGSTANTFGFKLEEILSILGTLANSGVEASMAGTAARNILLRLADANGKLAKTIGKPVRNIHELSEALNDLMKRGMNLGDALELTDRRSVNAFTRIAMAGKDLEKLSQTIAESEGRAKRMAEIMENNLGGSLTRLNSKWQDLWLTLSGNQGAMKAAVDYAEEFVGWLGEKARSELEKTANEINDIVERDSKKGSPAMQSFVETDTKRFQQLLEQQVKEGYVGDVAVDRAIVALQDELREEQRKAEETVVSIGEQINEIQGIAGKQSLGKYLAKSLSPAITFANNIGNIFGDLQEENEKRVSELLKQMKQPQIDAKLYEERIKNAEDFSKIDYSKSGLQLGETDQERNKRLQNEKNAAKQLLEAQKALEDNMLKLVLESAEKRRQVLKNQYKHEIQDLQFKIDETLKLRGDESEKERADKEAAADLYRQTIVKKREQLSQELERLEVAELSREIARAQEMYQLKLEGVEENGEQEYAIRLDILNKMMEAELNKLKEQALADENIKQESEARKLAIEAKYKKQRDKLSEEQSDSNQQRRIDEYEAAIIKASKDEVEAARLAAEEKQYILASMVQKQGETLEEYHLRQAQAEQDVINANTELQKKQEEANMRVFENAILQSNTELERMRAEVEAKKAALDNLHQYQNESDEKFYTRRLQTEKAYTDASKELANKEFQIRAAASKAVAGTFGSIAEAIENCADENEKSVKAAKILGLAQIYIQQGVAIAEAIHQAWATSSNWIEAIAATATSITTVVSSTIQAIKSIKKAQFAKGVIDIQGPGTGTSDSIDARISRGESVMTARATKMFKPLLAAMNGIAAQPNATLPTMYSTYNPSQVKADNQQFRDSMREALVDLHPVVSVEEINRVDKRLTTIKALDTI